MIAHVDFASPYRVGRYGVDVAAIDRLVEAALTRPGKVYLIDEIGKMECLSQVFTNRVEQLLAAGKLVIATVAKHGGGFIEEVKRWPGVELWEVTLGNRDALVNQAIAWLRERGIER
jgi:nucleoside-triphosphatase